MLLPPPNVRRSRMFVDTVFCDECGCTISQVVCRTTFYADGTWKMVMSHPEDPFQATVLMGGVGFGRRFLEGFHAAAVDLHKSSLN